MLNQELVVDHKISSSIADAINLGKLTFTLKKKTRNNYLFFLDVEEEGEIDSTDDSFSDSANESGNNFPMLTNPVIKNKSITSVKTQN